VLVNVVDRPDLCDFTVPSLLDRSPVLIAIGTGGASAGLAKALRLRLETLLPPSLGQLARRLAAARTRLRARWPEAGDRRRALDAALRQGGALDPLRADSVDRLGAWLEAAGEPSPAAVVEIRLRSADPDDLTLREARLLGSADVVAHEDGVPAVVLDRARADAARMTLGAGEAPAAHAGLVVVLRWERC
jgi:uroporphyrin-III C-methyltransferase/precorrin-2 dehydrogenase/sirohydrochlorin ferrochelatase